MIPQNNEHSNTALKSWRSDVIHQDAEMFAEVHAVAFYEDVCMDGELIFNVALKTEANKSTNMFYLDVLNYL